MVGNSKKEDCCGCGACYEACNKHAIIMKEDNEGFVYPEVNEQSCTQCGLCEKVCPFMGKYENKCIDTLMYAAYVKNENERINSSSGGIFGVIAQYVIQQGGVVCGAAYDENFGVSHILIDNVEDLYKLKGSKYLQSDNQGEFGKIKGQLLNGRSVLYSGTACQVAALKKFLGKNYDNLLTIDVLCHGVPSPKLWKKYIHELEMEHQSKVKTVNQRGKENGWKTFSMAIQFENGSQLLEKFTNNSYMKLFLSNICLRPSCYHCQYKEMNRPSDFTIGDYWGVDKQIPTMDDDKGTSLIKINTSKGKEVFERIKDEIVYKVVEMDIALPPTADSRKSVAIHPKREKFFKKLDRRTVSILVRMLEPSKLVKIKNKVRYKIRRISHH